MYNWNSICGRNGDTVINRHIFRQKFFGRKIWFQRRVDKQEWSPEMHEYLITRSVHIGRWSIGITCNTRHYKDKGWKAETAD